MKKELKMLIAEWLLGLALRVGQHDAYLVTTIKNYFEHKLKNP